MAAEIPPHVPIDNPEDPADDGGRSDILGIFRNVLRIVPEQTTAWLRQRLERDVADVSKGDTGASDASVAEADARLEVSLRMLHLAGSVSLQEVPRKLL